MTFQFSDFQIPTDFTQRYAAVPEVRPPHGDEEVRVHPTWQSPEVALVKFGSKHYLVQSTLFGLLAGRMSRCTLHAAASSKAGPFVWPVRLDMPSAVEAANKASSGWSRVMWDNLTRSYRVESVAESRAEPDWRFPSFEELLSGALQDRILDDPANPMVIQILGKGKKREPAVKLGV